jgi:hypothetical protein
VTKLGLDLIFVNQYGTGTWDRLQLPKEEAFDQGNSSGVLHSNGQSVVQFDGVAHHSPTNQTINDFYRTGNT